MPIRTLKIAVVVMGALIVAGTATLVVLIARRAAGPTATPAAAFAATLEEPEGTRITGLATVQDRLAVSLQGGGPDRVVLLDPHTGLRAGSVRLAR